MMKAYAGPTSNRGGGNSNRNGSQRGGILSRAGQAVRNGINRLTGRRGR